MNHANVNFVPVEDYRDSTIYKEDPDRVTHLNKKERVRLRRLRNRAAYLEVRIQGQGSRAAIGHRKGELSALLWAIDFIENTEVVDN